MENKSQKQKVLKVLLDAHIQNQTWHNYPLPLGYATTGSLHGPEVGGTNARVHIIMLRRAGIDIRYRKFPYINKITGELANPESDGVTIQAAIDSNYARVIDGFNEPIICHAYCIVTPLSSIDEDNCKLKPGIGKQENLSF